jgi:hypothetical protein
MGFSSFVGDPSRMVLVGMENMTLGIKWNRITVRQITLRRNKKLDFWGVMACTYSRQAFKLDERTLESS